MVLSLRKRIKARLGELPRKLVIPLTSIIAFIVADIVLIVYHDVQDAVVGPSLDTVVADSMIAPGDSMFSKLAGLVTFTTLLPGNRIEVLVGPATYPRLWGDLRAARRSITVQMYYCLEGTVADSVTAILTAKAQQHVTVLFLPDDFGCEMGDDNIDQMRTAGVQVSLFRPLHWYSLHRSQHRSHARAVVIDGTIGYTGGAGFDDKWLLPLDGVPPWQDLNVRIEGPASRTLQAAFVSAWAEATGSVLTGPAFFPDLEQSTTTGGALAGVLYSPPTAGGTSAERFLALTFGFARRTLYIINPYFLPGHGLETLLASAARRGVDVRLITAGDRNDIRTVRHASRATYQKLLEAGVRIFEYLPTMNHSKLVVADGVWSTIGSLNLDARSLRLNEEVTLLMQDSATGARLDSIFLAEQARSREIELEPFRRRGWPIRAWQNFLHVFSPLL
jgi:cardiolipin synthase A/B